MKKNLLWNLFKNTGKIEYYMKYKEERSKESEKSHNNRKNI